MTPPVRAGLVAHEPRAVTRALDVSALPTSAFGPRATVWWGVIGLIVIEGMGFALLVASYFYGRMAEVAWPPEGTPLPALGIPTANLVVLVVSVLPMILAGRAARRRSARGVALWFAVGGVLTVVSLVLRWFEFHAMHIGFDVNFYGSAVWVLLGMHASHLLASLIEDALLGLVMVMGPLDETHFVDAESNVLYWYFIVGAWLPLYAVLYLAPRVL
jgi:heme/copper-type cytochrome/quinol oxidase subunit 3